MRLTVRLFFAALLALPASQVAAQAPADPRVTRADLSRIEGKPNAPTWILVISDFQCPYCKEFHDVTAAQLRKEFVATGQARLAYINFPLRIHPNAMPAAEAAMCAGAQDRFWPAHDRIFAAQPEWAAATDPLPIFGRIARELKLDVPAWNACMSGHVMRPMIQADQQRGSAVGVKSTPSFLVGSVKIDGNAPIAAFRSAMKQARGGS
jgi:protein-disulfide isomerase